MKRRAGWVDGLGGRGGGREGGRVGEGEAATRAHAHIARPCARARARSGTKQPLPRFPKESIQAGVAPSLSISLSLYPSPSPSPSLSLPPSPFLSPSIPPSLSLSGQEPPTTTATPPPPFARPGRGRGPGRSQPARPALSSRLHVPQGPACCRRAPAPRQALATANARTHKLWKCLQLFASQVKLGAAGLLLRDRCPPRVSSAPPVPPHGPAARGARQGCTCCWRWRRWPAWAAAPGSTSPTQANSPPYTHTHTTHTHTHTHTTRTRTHTQHAHTQILPSSLPPSLPTIYIYIIYQILYIIYYIILYMYIYSLPPPVSYSASRQSSPLFPRFSPRALGSAQPLHPLPFGGPSSLF